MTPKALSAAIFALCVTACGTPAWLTVEAPIERRPSPAICAAPPAEPEIPEDAQTNAAAVRYVADLLLHGRAGWAVVAKERAQRCGEAAAKPVE